MSFTPEQKRKLEDIVNDATIDHNLHIQRERDKFGQPEHQKIHVSDTILLPIILVSWKRDVLETGFGPNWQEELATKTGNQDFLDFDESDLRPYQVRAGILLEQAPDYLARMQEQRGSRSFMQTGSEVAGFIAGVLDKGYEGE